MAPYRSSFRTDRPLDRRLPRIMLGNSCCPISLVVWDHDDRATTEAALVHVRPVYHSLRDVIYLEPRLWYFRQRGIIQMFKVYNCIATAHDLWLVGLAAIVCAVASCAAINLLRHARGSAGHMRGVWL